MKKTLSKIKQFKISNKFSLILLFLLLIYLLKSSYQFAPDIIKTNFQFIQTWLNVYISEKKEILLFVVFFTHILSSVLSLPFCTLINLLSGYMFGLTQAIFIIYSATFLSSIIGYFVGFKLGSHNRLMQKLTQKFNQHIPQSQAQFTTLVSLRLSPFIPFGILNLFLGALKTPFHLYITSTMIGVFFDVVLLTWLGDTVKNIGSYSPEKIIYIFVFFLILFGFAYLLMKKKVNLHD